MLAAVVFCQGCPWRCRYCHNPHLQPPRAAAELAWSGVRAFLERRRGLLDAVVFSGGEPTAQEALEDAAREVRAMGFRVGLHTAGIYPRRLARVLPHVDWVGFDVKTAFDRYAGVTLAEGSGAPALQSLREVLKSGVAHEVRTTVHADLIAPAALAGLASMLASLGVRRYVLQQFRSDGCTDAALNRSPRGDCPGPEFAGRMGELFESFELRSA
jgi:pyruvate formate lyase activating enzyme